MSNPNPTGGFDQHPENINRDGAPKKEWTWAGLIKEIVERVNKEDKVEQKVKMVEAIVKKSLKGDVQAFKELTNRMEGMPRQTTDINLEGRIEIDKLAKKVKDLLEKDEND